MRIHDYLEYWARRFPDDPCVTDDERVLTWGQFRSLAIRIGSWLSAELEPGARVAVLAKNSIELLALYFGASWSGTVLVPLNIRLARREWFHILNDAAVSMVVADEELAARLAVTIDELRIERSVIGAAPVGWRSLTDEIETAPVVSLHRQFNPSRPLYMMYTSGTTGAPKGAVMSNDAVCANVAQIQTALGRSGGKAMVVMPLFHCAAAITAFAYLASKTPLRIVRAFEPPAVLQILAREAITMTNLAPAMIQMLLDEPTISEDPAPDLELIVYGASPISAGLLRSAMRTFSCDFMQAYGMTELGAVSTFLNPEDHRRALESAPDLLLSVGRPVVGTTVRIVSEDGGDAGAGEAGEVLVTGPQIMTGYWKRAAATAETLRRSWLHTGDAGYLDADGYLFLTDRIKDMIVSGGENVYSRETENALLDHPDIADAAVIGIPDERWGEAVKAYVVLRPDSDLSEEAVIAHCKGRLAGFKCPKAVEFIGELPRTVTGKVLKRELRAPHWTAKAQLK